MDPVKSPARTLRAEKAERTRQHILQAALELFATDGFATTTIDAIAAKADVASETVYSRFGNKVTLLREILEVAIVGNTQGVDILELPDISTIRAMTDQRTQLAHLTHLSRSILERSALGHRILRKSAAADSALAEFVHVDQQRRHRVQTAYIAMLITNGPLRDGMNAADAAATYGALANPETYDFLVDRQRWSPDHYESWLHNALTLLLLAPSTEAMADGPHGRISLDERSALD